MVHGGLSPQRCRRQEDELGGQISFNCTKIEASKLGVLQCWTGLSIAEIKCSWGGTALTAKTRSCCGIAAKLFRSRRPVYTPAPARPIHPSSPNEERITWNGRREKRRERGRKSNANSSDVCLRPFLRDPRPPDFTRTGGGAVRHNTREGRSFR